MFLISVPDLKSLVARMVNLHITHNVSSNIALIFKYCIELLKYFQNELWTPPCSVPRVAKEQECLFGWADLLRSLHTLKKKNQNDTTCF